MHRIVQDGIFATRRTMTEPETTVEKEPGRKTELVLQNELPSSALLTAMAATIGLELPEERAAALAIQAEPHFALLRALEDIAPSNTEPAAEFHLDSWRSATDG
jgi:hypothetical protein